MVQISSAGVSLLGLLFTAFPVSCWIAENKNLGKSIQQCQTALDGCAMGIYSIKHIENLHHYLSLMKLHSCFLVFTTVGSHELNQIHTAVNLCYGEVLRSGVAKISNQAFSAILWFPKQDLSKFVAHGATENSSDKKFATGTWWWKNMHQQLMKKSKSSTANLERGGNHHKKTHI